MKLLPDGYIKRVTSTIPFGYELTDESATFLKPIPEQIAALEIAEAMIPIGHAQIFWRITPRIKTKLRPNTTHCAIAFNAGRKSMAQM